MEPTHDTIRSIRKLALAAALVWLGLAMPNAVQADQVIFSNLGPGGTYEFDIGDQVQGASSGLGGEAASAAFFTVATGANLNLTQIDIALTNLSGTNGATVELLADASGSPGSQVLGTWNLTGLPPFGLSTSSIQPGQTISGITGITLNAGTTYWLAAFPAASDTADAWDQNINNSNFNYARSTDGGTTWVFNANFITPAFDVLGTPVSTPAPEPSSLLLLGTGLLGVAGLAWRRRRFV